MASELLTVIIVAFLAAFLTFLGAPLAERLDVPERVVAGALQFAAGIMTALVALSLMPPAVRGGNPLTIPTAFFAGGAALVGLEYVLSKRLPTRLEPGRAAPPVGLYVGVLVDMLVDGVIIGIGATLSLATGVLLAAGIAVSTLPLAFVTTTAAKQQGVALRSRRILSVLYMLFIIGGALMGFILLRNQPPALRMALVAFASGVLLTTVTQNMIPEAIRDGNRSIGALLFLAGLTVYAMLTLLVS